MPRRRSDYRGLLESNRVRLLGAIQARPGQTLKELSAQTRIPLNTARDHLWTLQGEGLVSSQRVSTGKRGRPPLVYYAVDSATMSHAARTRLQRAEERRRKLREILGLRAGEQESVVARQLELLYEHLEDVALAPAAVADRFQIELSPEKHRELYEELGSLLCEIHAQLIEDTLALSGGPLAVGELKPFVTPTRCLLILHLQENAPEGTVVKDCSERIKPV